MNYSEILSRYEETERLMYGALLHVLNNLPALHVIKTTSLSIDNGADRGISIHCGEEETVQVMVDRVYAFAGAVRIDGIVKFLWTQAKSIPVDPHDVKAVAALLRAVNKALGPDLMAQIPPYEPRPQTILVASEENTTRYIELDGSPKKLKRWLDGLESPELLRRAWLTRTEEEAYAKGVDDATGWLETCFVDNPDGCYDKK